MAKIVLPSISTKDITIKTGEKEITFKIRALTRDEYYDITQKYAIIDEIEDMKEKIAFQKELEEEILDLCIEDDEVKELVKKSSYNVVNTIIDEIFKLSGLGEITRKNLR